MMRKNFEETMHKFAQPFVFVLKNSIKYFNLGTNICREQEMTPSDQVY